MVEIVSDLSLKQGLKNKRVKNHNRKYVKRFCDFKHYTFESKSKKHDPQTWLVLNFDDNPDKLNCVHLE